jgi:DNA-binding FadR family transcriptional regulator
VLYYNHLINMINKEPKYPELSEFLRYLAREADDGNRLPALVDLRDQLGVSVATLREQMEVARALGLVEVRPKTGIRRLPYQFTPAVLKSLAYATEVDPNYFFQAFSDLRTHIETAYWHQAIQTLTEEDHCHLRQLIKRAFERLSGDPIEIPHSEHRELHLSIYRRLANPFVTGILEAYWEAYEAVGLNHYADISYLTTVWEYHQRMVEAIIAGDGEEGYRALVEHTNLIFQRARTVSD